MREREGGHIFDQNLTSFSTICPPEDSSILQEMVALHWQFTSKTRGLHVKASSEIKENQRIGEYTSHVLENAACVKLVKLKIGKYGADKNPYPCWDSHNRSVKLADGFILFQLMRDLE